jgi:hypothetical protein
MGKKLLANTSLLPEDLFVKVFRLLVSKVLRRIFIITMEPERIIGKNFILNSFINCIPYWLVSGLPKD